MEEAGSSSDSEYIDEESEYAEEGNEEVIILDDMDDGQGDDRHMCVTEY